MTPEHLVSQIRKYSIDEILKEYRQHFEEIPSEDALDSFWKDAIRLYQDLDPRQRIALLGIIRQGLVDNTSSLLAIFDGASYVEGQEDDLEVFYSETGEKLSGDMQTIFLIAEEG